jgi:DNA (cytosine-5)-methyltransferase 1
MTFGSLFSGIGGIDFGLERAGMTCRWQVENDPYAVQVLAKHWPGVKRYGDIRTVHGSELEPVDLICGGFPCQDLSQAGKQAGIEGTRSGLWFEYARLVRRLRPRYVLIENVSGLLVYDAMRRVVGELARLGYVGVWRSLRAKDFGASHERKRVFIVAYTERARRPTTGFGRDIHAGGEPEAGSGELAYGIGEALEERPGIGGDVPWQCATFERVGGTLPAFAPGPNDPRWPAILAERPDLAPALESQICGVADGTPDWLDRAMSNRTKRLGRLGNAVVPDCAEWIGLRILAISEVLP